MRYSIPVYCADRNEMETYSHVIRMNTHLSPVRCIDSGEFVRAVTRNVHRDAIHSAIVITNKKSNAMIKPVVNLLGDMKRIYPEVPLILIDLMRLIRFDTAAGVAIRGLAPMSELLDALSVVTWEESCTVAA